MLNDFQKDMSTRRVNAIKRRWYKDSKKVGLKVGCPISLGFFIFTKSFNLISCGDFCGEVYGVECGCACSTLRLKECAETYWKWIRGY